LRDSHPNEINRIFYNNFCIIELSIEAWGGSYTPNQVDNADKEMKRNEDLLREILMIIEKHPFDEGMTG
jgi:hypothetical protein